jgi:hypothetical protein
MYVTRCKIESGARGEEMEEREMMMSEMRMREPVAALLRNQPPFSRSHGSSFHFFISHFASPSLHDIALPSLILGTTESITSLTITMFALNRHVESLAAAVSPYYTPE